MPGAEVLGDHVEARRHVEHQLASSVGLQVDADTPFPQVVAEEGGAEATALGVGDGRLRGSAELTARRLDLDDVGAEPRQELCREGERLHLLERQHPDADERPGRAPVRGLSGQLDHDWI